MFTTHADITLDDTFSALAYHWACGLARELPYGSARMADELIRRTADGRLTLPELENTVSRLNSHLLFGHRMAAELSALDRLPAGVRWNDEHQRLTIDGFRYDLIPDAHLAEQVGELQDARAKR
ncbi:hypothetical protein [Kocuria rosea]|uniref:Uncharacterized protein n=1 Tax=Kocuria rosea subsp. polaris TaxID=136273 RepID=A0A0A6YAS9_KOCRO|nr:hypothetical protein [Kocuria polaris]KHD96452.1 hypothetical protein GY22_15785 [Kocuria polaris]